MKHVSTHSLYSEKVWTLLIWTTIVNTWTHLLGALIYSLIPLDFYPEFKKQYATATFGDVIMLGIFFSGVTVCFTFSTL